MEGQQGETQRRIMAADERREVVVGVTRRASLMVSLEEAEPRERARISRNFK